MLARYLIHCRDLGDKIENREQSTIVKRNGKIAEQGEETRGRFDTCGHVHFQTYE